MRATTIVATSLAVVLGTSVGAVAGSDDGAGLPSYDVRTAASAKEPVTPTTGFVGRTDGYLTAASGRSAEEVARAFLRARPQALGLARDDVASLELSDGYTSGNGVRHLTFDQLVEGVPVWGGQVLANVDRKGRLVNVSGDPVSGPSLDTTRPDLTRLQALHRARADVGGPTSGGFTDIESASLVAFPIGKGAELAWEVWVDSPGSTTAPAGPGWPATTPGPTPTSTTTTSPTPRRTSPRWAPTGTTRCSSSPTPAARRGAAPGRAPLRR